MELSRTRTELNYPQVGLKYTAMDLNGALVEPTVLQCSWVAFQWQQIVLWPLVWLDLTLVELDRTLVDLDCTPVLLD